MTIMEIMKRVAISLLVLLLLLGCAGKKDKGLKTVQGDPETLYKQALADFNAKNIKMRSRNSNCSGRIFQIALPMRRGRN